MLLTILCSVIVGIGLGIAIAAKRMNTMIDVERRSCTISKIYLENENKRLCSEIEELHKQLKQ